MKRHLSMIGIVTTLVLAPIAMAGDDCCPVGAHEQTQAGALPEGHPPVEAAASDGAVLPEGHPPLSDGRTAMPEGHPAIPGMTAPATFTGKVIVKAVQGTTDAAIPTGAKVTIELYRRGRMTAPVEAVLNADGEATFENLSVQSGALPVVMVEHAGMLFGALGVPMRPDAAEQTVNAPVFEVAAEMPEWRVAVRHVMVRRMQQALYVTEVLSIESPGDRAWPGEPVEAGDSADAQGAIGQLTTGRVALTLPLPAGASHFNLGEGFFAPCTRIVNGKVLSGMPIVPGTSQYQFSYVVPLTDGKAVLTLAVPTKVEKMMVMAPADAVEVSADGMEPSTTMGSHGDLRVFEARDLPANKPITLTIQFMQSESPRASATPAPTGPDPQPDHAPAANKVVAGVGTGTLALAAAVIIANRSRKARTHRQASPR